MFIPPSPMSSSSTTTSLVSVTQSINELNSILSEGEPILKRLNSLYSLFGPSVKRKDCLELVEIYNQSIQQTLEQQEKIKSVSLVLKNYHSSLVAVKKRKSSCSSPTSHQETGVSESTQSKKPKTNNSTSLHAESEFKQGDNVAVKLSTNSFWISAVIIRFVQDKGKWEVLDAEDDDDKPGTKKRYLIPNSDFKIIRIPKGDETGGAKREFPKGSKVLALYPGSSCYYQAVVAATPCQLNHPQYKVKFEDDDNLERIVQQVDVLHFPSKPSS